MLIGYLHEREVEAPELLYELFDLDAAHAHHFVELQVADGHASVHTYTGIAIETMLIVMMMMMITIHEPPVISIQTNEQTKELLPSLSVVSSRT
jgi:hypothetical protein